MNTRERILFVAPALASRTGGEVYNAHLIHALAEHAIVWPVESLRVRERLRSGTARFSRWLAAKNRFLILLSRLWFLAVFGWRRRNVVADWESTDDVRWLLRANELLGGKNIVCVFHFDDSEGMSANAVARLRRRQLRSADAIITISDFVCRQLEELRISAEVKVFRPGRHRPVAERSAAGRSVIPVRLLFVGSLIARKSVHILIEAVASLRERTFLLSLVGDLGSSCYVKKLRSDIRRHGLEKCVEMTGRVEEKVLGEYYDRAQIFVFPSTMEGYGIAVADAMCAGLAVITTHAGALPELVEDGVNEILTQPGDASEFSAALSTLIADAPLRARMGEKSLEKARGFGDWAALRAACSTYVIEAFRA